MVWIAVLDVKGREAVHEGDTLRDLVKGMEKWYGDNDREFPGLRRIYYLSDDIERDLPEKYLAMIAIHIDDVCEANKSEDYRRNAAYEKYCDDWVSEARENGLR